MDRADALTEISAQLRAVLAPIVPGLEGLDDRQSLFDAGGIDSLVFLRILRTVEEHCACPLTDSDVILADFSSIRAIAAHVARIRSAQPARPGIGRPPADGGAA